MGRFYIDAYAEKNLGRERELNEDNCFCYPDNGQAKSGILSVLIVADGMGGHDAGDVASNLACSYLDHLFAKGGYHNFAKSLDLASEDFQNIIRRAFLEINQRVLERANAFRQQRSMGSTCVLGIIVYDAKRDKTSLFVGSVGDSRCYIVRGNEIILATQDDSYVWELYKKAEISYSDIQTHPQRNIITQALGTSETITPQVNRIDLESNDIVLLCTDGLHGSISDQHIKKILKGSSNAKTACVRLIEAANKAGGKDNIAVAVAYCLSAPRERTLLYHAERPPITKTLLFITISLLVFGGLAALVFLQPWKSENISIVPRVDYRIESRPSERTVLSEDTAHFYLRIMPAIPDSMEYLYSVLVRTNHGKYRDEQNLAKLRKGLNQRYRLTLTLKDTGWTILFMSLLNKSGDIICTTIDSMFVQSSAKTINFKE